MAGVLVVAPAVAAMSRRRHFLLRLAMGFCQVMAAVVGVWSVH
jgi:hypothetical protein